MEGDVPFCLAGEPGRSSAPLEVRNPFNGTVIARTWLAGDAEFERAVTAAEHAAPLMRRMPAHERASILMTISSELRSRRDAVARTIAAEAGKPIKDATTEAERAVMTFQVAAEEARRLGGEVIPMDLAPHGEQRAAITRRYPIGPIAAI